MAEFLLAILAFVVAHVAPPAPPVRRRLISWLGRPAYLLGYSVLSLGLLGWIIAAARRAPYVPLWDPAPWQAVLPVVAMPLAFWLVITGLAEPNPLSITLYRAGSPAPLPPIAAVTRHPILWGFLIWAGAHIPANGDVVSLILFGGMAALAIAGIPALDRRARRQLGERRWRALTRRASIVPFAALLSRRARIHSSPAFLLQAAAGIALYLWFLLQGHRVLIGPDPLAWLAW